MVYTAVCTFSVDRTFKAPSRSHSESHRSCPVTLFFRTPEPIPVSTTTRAVKPGSDTHSLSLHWEWGCSHSLPSVLPTGQAQEATHGGSPFALADQRLALHHQLTVRPHPPDVWPTAPARGSLCLLKLCFVSRLARNPTRIRLCVDPPDLQFLKRNVFLSLGFGLFHTH